MLVNLFTAVKGYGVPVTLREFLDLLTALEKRLVFANWNDFYYLSRSIMVKDEKYFDKFDRAFDIYFRGIENLDDIFKTIIPDEWLNYTLSLSPISTKTFILSNCSSIVYSLVYAYYGAILGRMVLTQKGLLETNYSILDWSLMILGIIATIISIIIVTRISKNAYEKAIIETN